MSTAAEALALWMGDYPDRYFVVTGTPGHGIPQIRVRLFVATREEGKLLERLVVTESGTVADGPSLVHRALSRWHAGQYDQIQAAVEAHPHPESTS